MDAGGFILLEEMILVCSCLSESTPSDPIESTVWIKIYGVRRCFPPVMERIQTSSNFQPLVGIHKSVKDGSQMQNLMIMFGQMEPILLQCSIKSSTEQ